MSWQDWFSLGANILALVLVLVGLFFLSPWGTRWVGRRAANKILENIKKERENAAK